MATNWLGVLTILATASLTLLVAITAEVTWLGAVARGTRQITLGLLVSILSRCKGTPMSKVAELFDAVLAGNADVVAKTAAADEALRVANDQEQVRLDARAALESAISELGIELRAQAETSPLGRERYLELWRGIFATLAPQDPRSAPRVAA